MKILTGGKARDPAKERWRVDLVINSRADGSRESHVNWHIKKLVDMCFLHKVQMKEDFRREI